MKIEVGGEKKRAKFWAALGRVVPTRAAVAGRGPEHPLPSPLLSPILPKKKSGLGATPSPGRIRNSPKSNRWCLLCFFCFFFISVSLFLSPNTSQPKPENPTPQNPAPHTPHPKPQTPNPTQTRTILVAPSKLFSFPFLSSFSFFLSFSI